MSVETEKVVLLVGVMEGERVPVIAGALAQETIAIMGDEDWAEKKIDLIHLSECGDLGYDFREVVIEIPVEELAAAAARPPAVTASVSN